MLIYGIRLATQEDMEQSSAKSVREIRGIKVVSQIKQQGEKSNKAQHFDANADMSKLLTGVTAGAATALQRLIYYYYYFCVIDYYRIMCIIPLASEIQTAKRCGYIYENSKVANKTLQNKWNGQNPPILIFFFYKTRLTHANLQIGLLHW